MTCVIISLPKPTSANALKCQPLLFRCSFFCINGATCVVCCTTSATSCRIFLHSGLCFIHSFFSVFLDATCVVCCTASSTGRRIFLHFRLCMICSFFYMFFDATCVSFCSASATAGRGFFSANCTGLISTSPTCSSTSTTGNGNTAASQQANDSDSGKDLFQFLCVHGLLLLS